MLKSLLLASASICIASSAFSANVEVGPRPYYLIEQIQNAELKDRLSSCANMEFAPSTFSIGHRGAAMQFPEHTEQSYQAAARMGAGIIECDVTFTKDKELVCRHAQNDLATTTNIVISNLATKCTKPFTPAQDGETASAECRTSDITLAEFQTLVGKMDASDGSAATAEEFLGGTANWRTDLYAQNGTVMTHQESIELIKSLGAKFTPELKSPSVEMPFDGMSQEDYAQKMIDEYKDAGIPPSHVWAQSFNLDDVLYWIKNEPEFGAQAVFLDEGGGSENWDNMNPETWAHDMKNLKAQGVNYIAPALWMLVTDENGKIVPSSYAKEARAADLKIIAWSLERSGPLSSGGGWYYQGLDNIINNDGMMYELVDVLAQDVGVVGIFSDWPATVTYYANCMGI